MDLTCDNYHSMLSSIESQLRQCSFVAIDTEFTALLSQDKYANSYFDLPEDRYQKYKENFGDISINQLGLTIFVPSPGNDCSDFTAHVYNMYVKPSSFLDHDTCVLMRASSVDFLCLYDFDFNKWLYSGVPSLNETQLATVENSLQRLGKGSQHIQVPFEMRLSIQSAVAEIIKWSTNAKSDSNYCLKLNEDQLIEKEGNEASKCHFSESFTADPNLLPLLVSAIINRTQGVIVDRVDTHQILLSKSDNPGHVRTENETLWSSLSLSWLVRQTGASLLLQMIGQSKKPVTVHNGLIDLILIYKQFFNPLPPNLESFKSEMTSLFPTIYDTKVICETMQRESKGDVAAGDLFSQSSLNEMYQKLKTNTKFLFKPSVCIDVNNDKYGDSDCLHEACYDSFITGYSLLLLSHMRHCLKLPYGLRPRRLEARELLFTVKDLANIINLMRATATHLCLNAKDPVSRRPNWVVVERRGGGHSEAIELLIQPENNQNRCEDVSPLPPPTPLRVLLPQFSPKALQEVFSQFGAVDIKPLHSNRLIIAPAAYHTQRFILTRVQSDTLKFYPYNAFRHSPLVKRVLWSSMLLTSGISAVLLYRAVKTN